MNICKKIVNYEINIDICNFGKSLVKLHVLTHEMGDSCHLRQNILIITSE